MVSFLEKAIETAKIKTLADSVKSEMGTKYIVSGDSGHHYTPSSTAKDNTKSPTVG